MRRTKGRLQARRDALGLTLTRGTGPTSLGELLLAYFALRYPALRIDPVRATTPKKPPTTERQLTLF